MKFHYLNILIFLFPFLCCSPAQHKDGCPIQDSTDWKEHNLYGKVKTIEYYNVRLENASFKDIEDPSIEKKIVFNEYGKLVSMEDFHSLGEIIYKTSNYYDTNQRMIETLFVDFMDNSKYKQMYQYDNNDNLVLTRDYSCDSLVQITYIEQNGKKFVKSIIISEKSDTTIKYLHEEEQLLGNGELLKIKKSWIGENNEDIYSQTLKYDKNDNLIQNISISDFLGEIKTILEYDKKNCLKKSIFYANNIIDYETSFDDLKNPILIKNYKNGKLISTIKNQYSYDKCNNWIKKEVRIKGVGSNKFIPAFIETRIIEYYE